MPDACLSRETTIYEFDHWGMSKTFSMNSTAEAGCIGHIFHIRRLSGLICCKTKFGKHRQLLFCSLALEWSRMLALVAWALDRSNENDNSQKKKFYLYSQSESSPRYFMNSSLDAGCSARIAHTQRLASSICCGRMFDIADCVAECLLASYWSGRLGRPAVPPWFFAFVKKALSKRKRD